mmetsp:Transcript_6681/g.9784  ORF Transcript_6681/g.9784 Transcript_6681/m.9784 type:complete len:87 (+) Transcript_6681:327-587(+)
MQQLFSRENTFALNFRLSWFLAAALNTLEKYEFKNAPPNPLWGFCQLFLVEEGVHQKCLAPQKNHLRRRKCSKSERTACEKDSSYL